LPNGQQLKRALASIDFHAQTPVDSAERYRQDLKYFMGLRAFVARRHAETADFKVINPLAD